MTVHGLPAVCVAFAALALGCEAETSDSTGASPEPRDAWASGAASGAGGEIGVFTGGSGSSLVRPDSCVTAAYRSKLLPASLLFVVDRSGTMNCNTTTASAACETNPKTTDSRAPTKWSAMVESMLGAFGELAEVPNTFAGLSLFSNDDECGAQATPNVPLGFLDSRQLDRMKGALLNATPSGGTPIIGATILGFHHLHEQAKVTGNRFVVLVTDGADSCIGKYPVEGDVVTRFLDGDVPKALSVNIHTFVIGAPGSEDARGFLSRVAFAGGTARSPGCDRSGNTPASGSECHFDMTRSTDFGKDLSDTLRRISSETALTCEFDVPQPPTGLPLDTETVNVDYFRGGDMANTSNRVVLYRDDTKPCDQGATGWQYLEGKARIRLCGSLCDVARADVGAQIVVSVGCEPRVIR